MDGAALLQASGLCKSFPGVQALDGVDLQLRRGEIHGLAGQNGAGKSTLIKLLTGAEPADAGSMVFEGRPLRPSSPAEAEGLGLSTVYQEVHLIPELSVAENLVLGRQSTRWGLLRRGPDRARAALALQRLHVELDLDRDVGECSTAERQLVAIARALDVDCRLLILDEPTASLDDREVEALFGLLSRLRDQGLAVLFVTHFLDQMLELSDRISVLRNGRWVCTERASGLDRAALIERMLGPAMASSPLARSVDSPAPAEAGLGVLVRDRGAAGTETPGAGVPQPVVLDTRGLARRGRAVTRPVEPVDLRVRRGEVVGVAGLLGSGRTELARVLFGIDLATEGTMHIEGAPVRHRSPAEGLRSGLAMTCEDRRSEGIFPQLSVEQNLVLGLQAGRGLRRGDRAQQGALARSMVESFGIVTPSLETPAGKLSGGNQQKVLLGRALARRPRLLILDEPTRGVDVGGRVEIERCILKLAAEGLAVLLISSELEELCTLADRVVVLRGGRVVGEREAPVDVGSLRALLAGAA